MKSCKNSSKVMSLLSMCFQLTKLSTFITLSLLKSILHINKTGSTKLLNTRKCHVAKLHECSDKWKFCVHNEMFMKYSFILKVIFCQLVFHAGENASMYYHTFYKPLTILIQVSSPRVCKSMFMTATIFYFFHLTTVEILTNSLQKN